MRSLVEVPSERLTERLEVAAYYVVAEGLTNIAKYAEASYSTVSVVLGGHVMTVEVVDNGCGIDQKTLSRIFDVFYSTKPAGSGLGLATVKRIVEVHGGRVLVDSAPGRGTQFTISLPPALASPPLSKGGEGGVA